MSDTDILTSALGAAARAFLAELQNSTQARATAVAAARNAAPYGEAMMFDPLSDEPPLAYNPVGSKQERKMTALTYLGAIARINAAAKRGANSAEVSQYAQVAGYPDGRAVSGWNSRANSPRVIDNVDGARILNESGHAYLHELAADLNITIKGDVTPLPLP